MRFRIGVFWLLLFQDRREESRNLPLSLFCVKSKLRFQLLFGRDFGHGIGDNDSYKQLSIHESSAAQ